MIQFDNCAYVSNGLVKHHQLLVVLAYEINLSDFCWRPLPPAGHLKR